MFGIYLLAAAAFAWVESPFCWGCEPNTSAWLSGLRRSLKAVFVPFYELRDNEAFWWISFLEALFVLPLFALFLLALRWRFRKG
jgi:hypothetical protein